MRASVRLATTIAVLSLAAPAANASVSLSGVPGGAVYAGPTPTYDFETPAPVSGGLVTTGSVGGIRAQPLGSTGKYWTVGPSDGSPGTLDLSSYVRLNSVSFIWGSTDGYNTLEVLDRLGGVLASFTGADVALFPNGNQTSPATNPLATLTFSGGDRTNIGGLRLISSQNAFEVDNFSVAVPEAGTWAMMILGFGFIGSVLRAGRRRMRSAFA